jgi:hypothetical protein
MRAHILICLIIAILSPAVLAAEFDHPAEEAVALLKKAKKEYDLAEKSFLLAVSRIDPPERQNAARRAFEKRKKLWSQLCEADAEFEFAASGLPEESTTASLMPYWKDIHYFGLQTKQLKEQTEWMKVKWK